MLNTSRISMNALCRSRVVCYFASSSRRNSPSEKFSSLRLRTMNKYRAVCGCRRLGQYACISKIPIKCMHDTGRQSLGMHKENIRFEPFTPVFISGNRHYSTKAENIMNVFDRNAKKIQRNRTAMLPKPNVYDYIKEEMGFRIADRICDVKRKFNVAAELGCGRGHIAKHLYNDMVGTFYQCDMAEKVLDQAAVSPEVQTFKMQCDEENLPFEKNSLDLLVSSLCLHWVNDLPGTFKQINVALKPDAPVIGCMFGGDTLFELRVSLQLAETEREGGFSPHISPFTSVQDLGNLLNRAGFGMLTIDIDEMIVNFPSVFELMNDLKNMGESNASWKRRLHLPRDTMMAAAAIYKEMYGDKENDTIPATFQIINFIGWKPDPTQAKPAKRGSGQVSIQDIDKLDLIQKQVKEMKKDSAPNSEVSNEVDKLSKDFERLLNKTMQDSDENDKKK